jgi:hypothetical protein
MGGVWRRGNTLLLSAHLIILGDHGGHGGRIVVEFDSLISGRRILPREPPQVPGLEEHGDENEEEAHKVMARSVPFSTRSVLFAALRPER